MIKSYSNFFFLLGKPYLNFFFEFQIWNPDGFHGTSRGRGGKITSLLCHQGMCETLKIKMIFILQAYPSPSPVNKNWTFLLYDSAGLFDIDFWILSCWSGSVVIRLLRRRRNSREREMIWMPRSGRLRRRSGPWRTPWNWWTTGTKRTGKASTKSQSLVSPTCNCKSV